jgi:hypothetical protein
MKTLTCFLLSFFLLTTLTLSAQNATDTTTVIHKVIKQNGVSFIGKIISQDAREILLETDEIGLVYIPKHEVKEISIVSDSEKPLTGGLFTTRYFLTTNGFAVKKGDNYIQWNLFGPDFQFGIGKNFGVGIMTSWVGMPIIGTAKYSFDISKNVHAGVGFLGGTGSWAYPQYGLVLPFGFLTIGNQMYNVNVSTGYGGLFTERNETVYTLVDEPAYNSTNSISMVNNSYNHSEGRLLLSVAGMCRLNKKFSFVFDSFIMLPGKETFSQIIKENYNEGTGKVTYSLEMLPDERNPLIVLAPGLRFQATENSSFQFGFTGVHFDGEFLPVPIPLIQYFRKI